MQDYQIYVGQSKDLKTVCIDIKNAAGGEICCVPCALKYLKHFINAIKKTSSGNIPSELN